jgi:tRNA (guanine-N7-)-methyltransferase
MDQTPPADLKVDDSRVELIPESYVYRLDLEKVFGRSAPFQVDLGCGDGSFLLALAREFPEENFLGIERFAGRVRKASRKAKDLTNVRVLRLETSYAVRYLLPENSVHAFHLLFPDPWPKRRHQRRRLVNLEFLESVLAALAPGGAFRVVTDQRDYFDQIESLAGQCRDFVAKRNESTPLPSSAFERKFHEAGAEIYRLELRKSSPVI